MAIADDWNVDFIAKVISHVDGVLDYDTGAGTQPAVGDVIRGGTSGAVGKILARSGTAAVGTLTLTSVDGRFQDNETLTRCDKVDFDACPNTGGGIKVGDLLTGTGLSGTVRYIEYNLTSTAGAGSAWSEQFGTGPWTDNMALQVGGTTRALLNGTGSDLSGTWTGALVNEPTNATISPPSTDADSYATSNQDATQAVGNGTTTGVGQSFTGNGGIVDNVQFYLSKTGLPTGNATANIYAHSGTFGTSSVPTGAALATSVTFDVSTLTTSLALVNFRFTGANKISLTSGTRYVVTIEKSGGDVSNLVNVGTDASSPTHGGNLSTQAAAVWTADSTRDGIFFVRTMVSNSLIINFDGGTKAFSRFCKIQNTNTASPTKTGFVQRVYGVTATGSLRLVDTAGTWADNDEIYVVKVKYDALETGQKFKVGDKIVTKVPPGGGADVITGKIVEVETVTATTGILTLQNQSGLVTDNDRIEVRTTSDTLVALVNAPLPADQYVKHADVNQFSASVTEIKTQLATQGGTYSTSDGLNIVRDCNELYTLLQDTFDELSALDDEIPMTAQVALQQYTLVNNWKVPDPSYRFLESGSIQDSGLDNIWTNYQTLGSVEGIGDTVYFATTPLPQFYIEQGGNLVTPWWKEGHVDVLVKVKTNTDSNLVSSTARGDGVLISSGTITLFNRNYTDTYDHFTTTTIASVAPVPLATSNDLDNATGTNNFTYTVGAGTFTLGEEIVADTDVTKRGIITKINTGPTSLDYELTGSTDFANTNAFTGQKSAATGTVNAAPTNLVASYGSRIIIATVEITITYASGNANSFTPGELVTQAGSGAKGILMKDTNPGGATGTLTIGNTTGTFNNTGIISGATRSVTANAVPTDVTTIQRDVAQAKTTGDGSGNQPYNAVIYLNRDNQAEGDTLARMYEWVKYKTRRLETAGEPDYNLIGGKGTEAGLAGRFYISQDTAYAPVKGSPLGTFAGGKFFGARGVFVQQMNSSDIRSFQLVDANGTVRNPPNKQTLKVDGVVSGDRVAVFRRVNSTPGSGIMVSEYTVAAFIAGDAWNGSGDTIIRVAAGTRTVSPLADDIPDSGVIRVRNATTQLYESFTYTAVDRTNNDFTVAALAANLTAGENVFVPLIESQATGTSVTQDIIHTGTDIPLLSRVRKRGILPFQAEGTFGSAGATVSAIRTADTIVD